ncbi:hypothetical protein MTO96_013379 [Rhipicephalus appendiculatus]
MRVIMLRQKNLKYFFYFVAAIFSLSLLLLSLLKTVSTEDGNALAPASLQFGDAADAPLPSSTSKTYRILIWDVGKRMSRRDSDVPVPYGRTVRLQEDNADVLRDYASSKTDLVAILGSNCGGANLRWPYVRELAKHVKVDVYGGCGTKVCPGHFTRDCGVTERYKFYLAFENSNCREYITEKLWWNAYHKEVVPVVMGATREEYARLAPPHSFIHVEDFEGPEDLARYLVYLAGNASAYNEYFAWKRKYVVKNEHGYFGSPSLHLCRMCEAVNRLQGATKVYKDLESFWNPKRDCRRPVWVPTY